jgi:hypothetical protein
MPADLVGASYPLNNPLKTLLGGLSNIYQPDIPARSNLEWFGAGTLVDGALAATGVGCFVPVPIDPGTLVTEISLLTGATAAETPTHQFAAIYAGTGEAPALIAQSTDTTSAAIGAKKRAGWKLTEPTIITNKMAEYGFIYVEIAITATVIPTAAVSATPAGINYGWSTNGPLFLSSTAGTALAGTAAATMASPAAKAVAPIVIVR